MALLQALKPRLQFRLHGHGLMLCTCHRPCKPSMTLNLCAFLLPERSSQLKFSQSASSAKPPPARQHAHGFGNPRQTLPPCTLPCMMPLTTLVEQHYWQDFRHRKHPVFPQDHAPNHPHPQFGSGPATKPHAFASILSPCPLSSEAMPAEIAQHLSTMRQTKLDRLFRPRRLLCSVSRLFWRLELRESYRVMESRHHLLKAVHRPPSRCVSASAWFCLHCLSPSPFLCYSFKLAFHL